MRTTTATLFALTLTLTLASAMPLLAVSPAQEKAFVEAYRKAFEAKDTKTLESFLYTKGNDPTVLEFYKTMQSGEAGSNIASIELVALTAAELKKALEPQDGPSGRLALPLKPTKKLVIKVATKDANGSSSSSSEILIADADGKLVVPVPGPVK